MDISWILRLRLSDIDKKSPHLETSNVDVLFKLTPGRQKIESGEKKVKKRKKTELRGKRKKTGMAFLKTEF